jgi:hypothetical protein
MASRRPKIDRRFSASPPNGSVAPAGVIVVFLDDWGEIAKRYDLGALSLPLDVAALLADAFRHHHAASRLDTQRHCWGSLRTFARFVAEDGNVRSAADLNTGMIGRYIAWLDRQRQPRTGQPWTKGARANQLTQLRQLIDWTKRHHPSRLSARIDFPYRVYPNRNAEPRPRLSDDQLKVILRACYEEIDGAWNRFETGRAILATTSPLEGADPELCDLIRSIASIDDGVLPPQKTLFAQGQGMAGITRQGGLRHLGGYLHLTADAVIPFLVAIMIQTAANPNAMRLIARDCQVPHPLDDNRVIIEWAKPRAGGRIKRAQRRSFDRRRPYAAPNLIDKVLAMTAALAAKAARRDQNRLFLLKSEKTGVVTTLPEGTLSQRVKHFINRSNARIAIWNQAAPERPRAFLPDFATAFLRGSVAIEHYKASGGDITVAQGVLNHARADTTEIYLKGPETSRIQRESIARLQDLMIGWFLGDEARAGDQLPADRMSLAADATAPFGHDCLNPLAGMAPGSTAGRLCRHFGGCLRCPGLVIPIDAEHMARILQARRELERARERLDPRRWELLYAPSYHVLVDEILSDFPEALQPEAEERIPFLPPLPTLE